MLVLGVDRSQQESANMLNYAIGCLLLVYLGILVFVVHLGLKALSGAVSWTRKMLQALEGDTHVIWGDRLIRS